MDYNIDHSIHPYDDFFLHVNNLWLGNIDIPRDMSLWSTFNEVKEENNLKLRQLLEEDRGQLNIIYNQAKNDRPEYIPRDMIEMIQECKTKEELKKIIILLFSCNNLIHGHNFSVAPDMNNSKVNILHLYSSGLGLPDKSYYEKKDETFYKYKEFVTQYTQYFDFLHFDVERIMEIELYLAHHTYSNVDKRNSFLQNNPISISNMSCLMNDLYSDICYFFSKNEIKMDDYLVNITNPEFTKHYYIMLNNTDLETLKQYFIYMLLRKLGTYIGKKTEEIIFNFYGKVLGGIKEMKPDWKRALNVVDEHAGMMLSKLYVERYFDHSKKDQALQMIDFIKLEYEERIKQLEWMSDITKEKAIRKLKKMRVKVGYPDRWIDFTTLNISADKSYLDNIMECMRFEFRQEIKDIYKNVDINKWFMNSFEINAYYAPDRNEIVFPAGILQAPFFSGDMASSFGGIGCIIGHEITHGFDDMGRHYDEDGNLKNWWSDEDATKYEIKTEQIITLFNNLIIHEQNVNGKLTLGENIADLGGVEIAYGAMKRYYGDKFDKEYAKRFFYNYATIWRHKINKEEILRRLTIDPHSPACFRVNMILPNINAFYDTFDIPKDCKMWLDPKLRVKIW